VLDAIDLRAAVIPHYDNKEGGNHDTRFCYLGERRLAMLERELPDDVFVLGVDEHTGVVIDVDAESAEIVGKGGITLRRGGHSVRIEAGETVPLDVLRRGGVGRPSRTTASGTLGPQPTGPTDPLVPGTEAPQPVVDSLGAAARVREADFTAAIDGGDADAAVGAILELEADIVEWSRDTLQSDDLDRARAALRSMIVRLGAAANDGLRDIREVIGPVVEAALAARVVARSERAFAVSDAIRDELAAAGIEVRDTPDGVTWLVAT